MDTFTREVEGRTFELVETRHGNNFRVFETTGGKRIELTRDIDLPDIETLTDEVLLALAEPRRIALAAVMARYGIVRGADYQYEDDYKLLYSTEPVGRYVQVSGDGPFHWIYVCDTREDAADAVAADILDQAGNDYPRRPIDICDLDTGRSLGWRTEVVVTLTD